MRKRNLSRINMIIVHCSGSDNKRHDNISTMRKWHKAKGWNDVGYHYFIRKDGALEKGRSENTMGAHTKGFNAQSIGVCLHGLKEEKFTENQKDTLAKLIKEINSRYEQKIDIIPHRTIANKSCPVIDMMEFFGRL